MLDVENATKELETKSMDDIERETALKWGARAAASYDLAGREKTLDARFRRFYEGENFRQEALEHASMVGDGAETVGEIKDAIEEHRSKALASLKNLAMGAPVR